MSSIRSEVIPLPELKFVFKIFNQYIFTEYPVSHGNAIDFWLQMAFYFDINTFLGHEQYGLFFYTIILQHRIIFKI